MGTEWTTADREPGGGFTLAHLERLIADVKRMQPVPRGPNKIVVTAMATRVLPGEYNFPPSPHRSARLHKKLVKRFGSYEKRVPATLTVGDTMFCHPAHYAALKAEAQAHLRVAAVQHSFNSIMGLPVLGGW